MERNWWSCCSYKNSSCLCCTMLHTIFFFWGEIKSKLNCKISSEGPSRQFHFADGIVIWTDPNEVFLHVFCVFCIPASAQASRQSTLMALQPWRPQPETSIPRIDATETNVTKLHATTTELTVAAFVMLSPQIGQIGGRLRIESHIVIGLLP